MTETLKAIAQLGKPTAATLTDLYTVPAVTSAVISSLIVCNQSNVATAFRVAIRPAGAAIAVAHYAYYDQPIDGNETVVLTAGITLATTDVVSVYNTLATLSFQLYGALIT